MENFGLKNQLLPEEKVKVAYALNLCAVSISQIIDSKDIVVLKQERESILNNLNLQNFVKHPALFDVLKQILDTVTYLEIQAGDMSFIEEEYQQKLKDAIWAAVPTRAILLSGGNFFSTAITVAAQIGTGYMNYRRNKNQYATEKAREEWALKRHEIEQLYGLRAQLFEAAWKLSEDYNFDDKYRLTETQLSRYSKALLEPDCLKRYEQLDVMSDRFDAFPPFWYHKGNAAMEIFHNENYARFSGSYKDEALKAYQKFQTTHFEFLREDIVAASCCLEHISLLEPNDEFIEKLLEQALRFAGDNYDVLQQAVLVNLQLGKIGKVILPLREMIANSYNVEFNGLILSKIYIDQSNQLEYEKLLEIAGKKNILEWADNSDTAQQDFFNANLHRLADGYRGMAVQVVSEVNANKSTMDAKSIYSKFHSITTSIVKRCGNNAEIVNTFKDADKMLEQAVNAAKRDRLEALRAFVTTAKSASDMLPTAKFNLQTVEGTDTLIEQMKEVTRS